MSHKNTSDWNNYSSDSSEDAKKENFLRKYSKRTQGILDEQELIGLFKQLNFNETEIEKEIQNKEAHIEKKGDDYKWKKVKNGKNEQISRASYHKYPRQYYGYNNNNNNYYYTSSFREAKKHFDYNNAPSNGYRYSHHTQRTKYNSKNKRRPFQPCIEVAPPKIPIPNTDRPTEQEYENNDKSKEELKKDGDEWYKNENKEENREEEREEEKEEDKESGGSLPDDDEESERDKIDECVEKNSKLIFFSKLKELTGTNKKLHNKPQNDEEREFEHQHEGETERLKRINRDILSDEEGYDIGYKVEDKVNNFTIHASYENPYRLFLLSQEKNPQNNQMMFPMMGPFVQPIPVPYNMLGMNYQMMKTPFMVPQQMMMPHPDQQQLQMEEFKKE